MARRRGGLFLPLDVHFMDDDRIEAAGEAAGWLYLAMCLKAKALQSDGVLTRRQIEKLDVKRWERRLSTLLRVDLLPDDERPLVMEIGPDRYWITAWDKHNDRAETVDERREKDRARKRMERLSERSPNGHAPGVRTESVSQEEKSREEKRGDPTARANPSGSSFGSPCEHGALFGSPCIECRGLRVVNE